MAEGALPANRCPGCGSELAPSLLACPACRRLTRGAELTELAAAAERATRAGDLSAALASWRSALELLPADTAQAATIRAKVTALSQRVDAGPARAASRLPRWLAPLGALGLLLWKLKLVLAFVLTKGKLLLLGLTKSSTLFSMLLSLGVYWSVWGWRFAAGIVALIYVHEMGHVAALHRLGIRASAPMFVPGLGAYVRLNQYPADVREDARVGLAGPLWGLGAALAVYLAFLAIDWPILAAIARVGAWLNLFNLLPVWQLDGGRGFRALAKRERWLLAALLAACGLATSESLALLLALAAAARAFGGAAPAASDRRAFVEYALLGVALSALCAIDVPGLTPP